jgi:hypothetical protein
MAFSEIVKYLATRSKCFEIREIYQNHMPDSTTIFVSNRTLAEDLETIQHDLDTKFLTS